MKNYKQQTRREQLFDAMWKAVNSKKGFTGLVKWVNNLKNTTPEMKEELAKRSVYSFLIRKTILQARADVREGNFDPSGYWNAILWWTARLAGEQKCHNFRENHTHTWECGQCLECLGTGRTLLLYPSRKRGTRCIACKGSGIRSQEFEQSDFRGLMEDDVYGHLLELIELQDEEETLEEEMLAVQAEEILAD